MARRRARRESQDETERLPLRAVDKLVAGSHHHTAEFYGASETRYLRPWAQRRVLEYAR